MVGRIFSQNASTFSRMDLTQSLKVHWAFVTNKPKEMQRLFDDAKTKQAAHDAVSTAIKGLAEDGDHGSNDLRFCEAIIARARASVPAETLQDLDFRKALHDAAWEASTGKGKLSILLRKSRGLIDGTRALKTDLRKLAEAGDWERLQKATKLAALLDAVKKCPTAKGGKAPESEDMERILGDHEEAVIALWFENLPVDPLRRADCVEEAYCDAHGLFMGDKKDFVQFIGEKLTDILHPDHAWRRALEAADKLGPHSESVLKPAALLNFAQDHFTLLTSNTFSEHRNVKLYYWEFFSITLSMAALSIVRDKHVSGAKINRRDAEDFLGTLKVLDGISPDGRSPVAKTVTGIVVNMSQADPEIFFDLCKESVHHYLDRLGVQGINIKGDDLVRCRKAADEALKFKDGAKLFEAMHGIFVSTFANIGFYKEHIMQPLRYGLEKHLGSVVQ